MNDKTIAIILFVFGGINLISLLIWVVIVDINSSEDFKIVKCYDKYNNEIIGQVCKDYPYHSPMEIFILLFGLLIVIVLFMLGFYFYDKGKL